MINKHPRNSLLEKSQMTTANEGCTPPSHFDNPSHLVISTCPPHETGIADFSQIVFAGDPRFKLESCESLAYSDVKNKAIDIVSRISMYNTITIVLGNSHHNLLAASVLRSLRGFKSVKRKIFLHVHDPVLTNLIAAKNIFKNEPYEYYQNLWLTRHYSTPPDESLFTEHNNWRLYQDYGITGIEYLTSLVPVHGLLLHSEYACNLYRQVLHKKYRYIIPKILKIAHPCFDEHTNIPHRDREYDLGIFGVMDNGGKMTNQAIQVFQKLRQLGKAKSCVLAGFNAYQWREANQNLDLSGCTFINNPSRQRLFDIMTNCKVGLQPRRASTGESSGIVPMLISANVPTITSNVGAFTEYPQNVVYPIENTTFCASAIAAFIQIRNQYLAGNTDDKSFYWYNTENSRAAFVDNFSNILNDSVEYSHIRLSNDKVVIRTQPTSIIRLDKDGDVEEKVINFHDKLNLKRLEISTKSEYANVLRQPKNAMDHLNSQYGKAFSQKKELVNNIVGNNPYLSVHSSRISLTALYAESFFKGCSSILELGFSNILHKVYSGDFDDWDYTSFRNPAEFSEPTSRKGVLIKDDFPSCASMEYIVNLEDEPIPCKSLSYDAIICTEVVEHMSCDPMFLMSEINRVLKPNGRLLLTTPNSASARIFHKIASGYMPSFYMCYTRDRSPYKHNFEYCPHSIRSLVEASGFTIESLDAVDTFNEPVPSALAMLESIGMSTELRGDNLFVLAIKTSEGILDRYPDMVYA